MSLEGGSLTSETWSVETVEQSLTVAAASRASFRFFKWGYSIVMGAAVVVVVVQKVEEGVGVWLKYGIEDILSQYFDDQSPFLSETKKILKKI